MSLVQVLFSPELTSEMLSTFQKMPHLYFFINVNFPRPNRPKSLPIVKIYHISTSFARYKDNYFIIESII